MLIVLNIASFGGLRLLVAYCLLLVVFCLLEELGFVCLGFRLFVGLVSGCKFRLMLMFVSSWCRVV